MIPGAVILALGGAGATGVGMAINRHVLKEHEQLFTEPEFFLGKITTAFLFSIALIVPSWALFGGEALARNSTIFYGALVMGAIANISFHVTSLYAARYADVSLTLPYQGMTPGLLTIVVFLLGEEPSRWGYLGIAMIAVGTYIHGRLGAGSLWAYLVPLWRLFFLPAGYHKLDAKVREKIRNEQRGVRFAFIAAFSGVFGLMSQALMARHGNPALGFSVDMMLVGIFGIAWCYMAAQKKSGSSPPRDASFRERFRLHKKWFLLSGLFLAGAGFLPMIANRLTHIAYVGSLKRLSIPIGVLIAASWFKEKVPSGRWITTAIITAGAIILAMDDTSVKVVDFMEKFLKGE